MTSDFMFESMKSSKSSRLLCDRYGMIESGISIKSCLRLGVSALAVVNVRIVTQKANINFFVIIYLIIFA